ncbi:uncharacterized protein LOC129806220 [Phlebotomus papatasi]|uniref:uncharacterized protein LOC129806220 n=1 Tax=Phlebotomus papatasi TaxID=29031 RepID=UPI00248418C5|nr:uncharacterized protein LOC129806220 [Phlebotomus papatasi]
MIKKVIFFGLICFSLVFSVTSLECYVCSVVVGDEPCHTTVKCEVNVPHLGPDYVCTKVVTTLYNVTTMEKSCGQPNFCNFMKEHNIVHDICEICNENRCNASESLHANLTISFIAFLSVIFLAK